MPTYTIKKSDFYISPEVKQIEIVLDAGKRFTILEHEIEDFSVKISDKLTQFKGETCFVCGGGSIKCRLELDWKPEPYDFETQTPDYDEYVETYAEKRKALFESICFPHKTDFVTVGFINNHSRTLCGQVCIDADENILTFSFNETPCVESVTASIDLLTLCPENIKKIELGFENCFCFPVCGYEIERIELDIDKNLSWLRRKIKSGFLEIKFDKTINPRGDFYGDELSTEEGIARICFKNDSTHDICNLYTYFNDYPEHYETIMAGNILPDVSLGIEYYCICGYAKELQNGNVLITFGERAKEILDNYEDM